jgi:GDP-L-fucose synthase
MATGDYPIGGKRVWVAGHRGMVGGALCRRLAAEGCVILAAGRDAVDLRRQAAVEAWMAAERPQAIFLAAATVGGIHANQSRPAEFLYDNLAIAANVVEAAHRQGVEKLMVLGSSCVYPRLAAQPVAEADLLTGPLEPTNEWYAVAKIAAIKLAQAYRRQYGCDFIAVNPTNLYGPGDNFDPAESHVVSALLRKLHEAKEQGGPVEIWGTGTPRREYLFVDDAADALVFLMRHYSAEAAINVAGGEEVTIADLAARVAEVVGYGGRLTFDPAKPDGMPRKVLQGERLAALGWRPRTPLNTGLRMTYRWYLGTVAARAEPVEAGERR